MFEAAEVGNTLADTVYKEQLQQLRVSLLELQASARQQRLSVIVVVAGDDRAGRHEVINLLHEWMDPHYLHASAYNTAIDRENDAPFFSRYWKTLPPKGEIGIFLGDWTTMSLVERLDGDIDDVKLDKRIGFINAFERGLVDDGTLLIKLWLHLPKSILKKRLKQRKKDPESQWRLREKDLQIYQNYDQSKLMMEKVLRRTNTGEAPWYIIESTDENYRNITVANILKAAIAKRITRQSQAERRRPRQETTGSAVTTTTVLQHLDLSRAIKKKKYKSELQRLQARLHELMWRAQDKGLSTVLVFEGVDAAGKGGAIRRITQAMDAGFYNIVTVSKPTQEELAYHYLWRFWKHVPMPGRTTIFDRSWYGRLLVERVEGFASEPEWMRAYNEINQFEEQLVEHGLLVLKFWLHIDPDEQMRRFELREQTPYKLYKITEEDYRNREKWSDYEIAANDMIQYCSTEFAPWHLVESQDKRYARIKVLSIVCEGLERQLKSLKGK